jgi:outer membrane protein assembly factor BamB
MPSGKALAIALCFTVALPAEEWNTFRGTPRRAGNVDGSELPGKLDVLWTFEAKGFASARFDSSPALAGGMVYLGVAEHSVFSPAGRVIALDAETGTLRWERKTRFPVFSSPSVSGGRVIVGEGYHQDSQARLYCLDAERGEERWSFETKSHIESSPHVEKDRVYFGAGEDGLYCLGLDDGKLAWRFPDAHVDISPLVASGLVFAGAGYGEPSAFSLAASDGQLKWKTALDLPAWGSPVLLGNRLFFGLGNGNFVQSAEKPRGAAICLAATSGKELWRRDLPDAVLTAIASAGERLFCGCRDGNIYALDARTGEIVWKRSLGGPIVASPLLGSRNVAAVSTPGRLAVLSGESGEELAGFDLARLAGEGAKDLTVYASPSARGGQIIVTAGRGAVAALGKKK